MPRNGLYNLNPYKINYDFGQKLDTSGLERAMALQNKWIEDNQNTENQLSDFVSSLNVSDYDKKELQNDYDKVLSEMRGLSSTLGLGRSVEYAQDAANAFKQKYSRYQQDYERYNKVIEKVEAKRLKGDIGERELTWFKKKNQFERNEDGTVKTFVTPESQSIENKADYEKYWNTAAQSVAPEVKTKITGNETSRGGDTTREDGTATGYRRSSGYDNEKSTTKLDYVPIMENLITMYNTNSDMRREIWQDYDITRDEYDELIDQYNKETDPNKKSNLKVKVDALYNALTRNGVFIKNKDGDITGFKNESNLESIDFNNFIIYRLYANNRIDNATYEQLRTRYTTKNEKYDSQNNRNLGTGTGDGSGNGNDNNLEANPLPDNSLIKATKGDPVQFGGNITTRPVYIPD